MVQFDRPPPAHLRLFCREFIDFVDYNLYEVLQNKFFNSKQITFLKEKINDANEDVVWEKRKRFLFKFLSFSDDPGAQDVLLQIFKEIGDKELINALYLKGLKSQTHAFYGKLLMDGELTMKLDRIVGALDPVVIVDYLRNLNCFDYEDLIKQVDYYVEAKQFDDAACALIRGLPCTDQKSSSRHAGDWYYDFLGACLSHGYTRMIPRYIDADYETDLDRHKAEKEAEGKKHIVYDSDIIVNIDEVLTKPRSQALYAKYRETSIDYVYEAQEYQLRPYQNELVSHAKRGRNTIICAPTGCGKTLVATDIILNHLRMARSSGTVARALMLVPTVPLVDQQTLEFVRYMAGEFWVDGFSGAESLHDRAGHFLASDVCVVTPQVIINMLNSILKTERIYFSDITLMIFDECHNCNEAHPYKILMEMLQDSQISHKPQIVGLTASLGVGQTSWDINACREHMLKMCSQLMADSITTVRHQMENLRSHVMPPVDIVMRARRPCNDEFSQLIKETMIKIQQRMKPSLEKVVEEKLAPLKKEDIAFPDLQHTSRYQTVVGSLKKTIQHLEDKELRMTLVRSIDHLAHYFHALGISDLLPNKYGLIYLDAKMDLYSMSNNRDGIDSFLVQTYTDIKKKLRHFAKHESFEHKEILQKLYGILHNQYAEKPESRTLIFVSTRACAQRLSEHLSEYLQTCEDLRVFFNKPSCVGFMTSTNQSAGAGGQSSEMQRTMRNRFERGELKILVVTSVADEGINIMECNLIVKYNTVGSERTLIQRRGRARAKDSRAILLALDGSVEMQEFENIKKEAMMLACINDLQAYRDELLQREIAKKTEQLQLEREQKLRNIKEQYERLRNKKYWLKCRACSAKISASMDIRCVANTLYVCCDPTIWARTQNAIIKRPTKDGLTTKCARLLCKCSEEWGMVVKYSSVFLPMLMVKSFVLEDYETGVTVAQGNVKTWVQIQREYFNVDPISSKNIKDMLYALTQSSVEEQKKMEEQEHLANQLALERRVEKKEKKKVYLDE